MAKTVQRRIISRYHWGVLRGGMGLGPRNFWRKVVVVWELLWLCDVDAVVVLPLPVWPVLILSFMPPLPPLLLFHRRVLIHARPDLDEKRNN